MLRIYRMRAREVPAFLRRCSRHQPLPEGGDDPKDWADAVALPVAVAAGEVQDWLRDKGIKPIAWGVAASETPHKQWIERRAEALLIALRDSDDAALLTLAF